MDLLNPVTLVLLLLAVGPILAGYLRPFSKQRIQYFLGSLLDNVEFLGGMILSIYLTKRIFFENGEGLFRQVYGMIPLTVRNALYGKDILTYIVSVPVILLFVLLVIRLVTTPFYNSVLVPVSHKVYTWISGLGRGAQQLAGALWQLPKSIYLPILAALLMNFYVYYFYSPALGIWISESPAYKLIYDRALYPVLNSNIAKQVPVILNDSFGEQLADKLSSSGIMVVEYFNGVKLDDAIKSNEEIDKTAKEITAGETGDKRKAFLIYKWISRNVDYDFEKAQNISRSSSGISSGSIVAFDTRKGICFDYSCLYVSMCRAAGLKVRLVTGLAYSGTMWGDHAWNQVYSSEEDRWIDLDATFGSSGVNCFDKANFEADHKYAVVQGEW